MATTKDAGWEATRHGGFRRSQSTRSSSGSRDVEPAGTTESPAGDEGKPQAPSGGTEHHPDKVEGDSASSRRAWSGEGPAGPTEGSVKSGWTGFESLLRDKFILKFNERLGLPSCPYVVRWRLETPWFSIRLHHWLAPDDDRARHDHPWSFTTFVLRGGYTDVGPCPTASECDPPCTVPCHEEHYSLDTREHEPESHNEHLRAPAVRYRKAEHQHTVVPDRGGAWTIIVTGPKVRTWGFWVKGRFVKSYRYFYKYGHHPCN